MDMTTLIWQNFELLKSLQKSNTPSVNGNINYILEMSLFWDDKIIKLCIIC